jgi:hypothetical protein
MPAERLSADRCEENAVFNSNLRTFETETGILKNVIAVWNVGQTKNSTPARFAFTFREVYSARFTVNIGRLRFPKSTDSGNSWLLNRCENAGSQSGRTRRRWEVHQRVPPGRSGVSDMATKSLLRLGSRSISGQPCRLFVGLFREMGTAKGLEIPVVQPLPPVNPTLFQPRALGFFFFVIRHAAHSV